MRLWGPAKVPSLSSITIIHSRRLRIPHHTNTYSVFVSKNQRVSFFLMFQIKNTPDSAFLLVLCHAALVGE